MFCQKISQLYKIMTYVLNMWTTYVLTKISLVMMLLMVKGKMRVTLPTTPTSPMVSHTNSHIVSITYSILTPLMTLASPNNDSLNDFDESKQVLVRTLWWDFLSSKNWHNNYHGTYCSIGTDRPNTNWPLCDKLIY